LNRSAASLGGRLTNDGQSGAAPGGSGWAYSPTAFNCRRRSQTPVSAFLQRRTPFQDRSQASLRIEGDAPVLRVLGVRAGDDDLMLGPVHVAVLDAQHLPLAAARLECADDAVVHRRAHELMFRRVHRQARGQERLLLVAVDAPIPLRLFPGLDRYAEAMERRRRQQRRILESSPVDRRA